MPTLTSIAHGKEGSITFISEGAAGVGTYGANCFDVSLEITNAAAEVTTFDTATDFTDTIPGKTSASGSFSVWVDDATAMGLADLHFDPGTDFPALTVVLGATNVVMASVRITSIDTTQDPNGVPAFVCSYVSVGTFTSS